MRTYAMNTFMKLIYTLFIALMLTPCIGAVQARSLMYDCPDINNPSKQTLGQIYQGYDGWFFKDVDFKQNYLLAPETLSYLKRFNDALAAKGVQLVFMPLVSKSIMVYDKLTPEDIARLDYNYDEVAQSYKSFIQQLSNADILVPDLLTPIEKYKGDMADLIFKIDHHWTPEGAMQDAKVIAELIKQDPAYESLPKIETTYTKLDEPLIVPSSMHVEASRLCTTPIPSESLNIYDFTTVTEKNADALFVDDASASQIVLVGTSFSSVNNFKFRDFLEHKTKLGVTNYSIPGGELYISLISYLSSPYFKDEKPQYLIWESPSKYNYNELHASSLRQIIPSVYGTCSGENLLVETSLSLDETTTQKPLFDGLNDMKLMGNDYYLNLTTDNLIFNKFTLNLEYDDGDGEWFNMDHSGRYKNHGDFYLELSEDIESNLSHITIENTSEVPTNLTVKICKK